MGSSVYSDWAVQVQHNNPPVAVLVHVAEPVFEGGAVAVDYVYLVTTNRNFGSTVPADYY